MKSASTQTALRADNAVHGIGTADAGYERLPLWLETPEDNLFAWLHIPYDRRARSTGIVICSPLGYEYTHSHRTLRHLADQLAAARYPALRIDLHGMGNSPGDLLTDKLLERWLSNIEGAIDKLRQLAGVNSICLFGVRMGATLAARVAERTPVDMLILCNPCVSGRRYVREMQAIHRMAERSSGEGEDYIESAGFIMTAATAAAIKAINLAKQEYQVGIKILLLARDDLAAEQDLAAALRQRALPVDEITIEGYAAMMAEPQATEVPATALADIVDWINANMRDGIERFINTRAEDYPQEVVFEHELTESLSEKICVLGAQRPVLGVLSQPRGGAKPDQPLIVLLNSGSVHHVGPHRLYVALCRQLCRAGFATLRIDLANLGDSVVGSPANENHPYPEHANADVESVLNSIQQDYGYDRFVLTGICSGAHTAFHAGLIYSTVCEAMLINPLTFYWQEGMSLEIPHAHRAIKDAKYYKSVARDRRKWLKLLKGQVQLAYLLRFVASHARQKLREHIRHLSQLAGSRVTSRLGFDLIRYCEAGKQLSFFFSSTDPGYDILLSEAPRISRKHIKEGAIHITVFEDADHTFSAKLKRDELIDKVTAYLRSRYQ